VLYFVEMMLIYTKFGANLINISKVIQAVKQSGFTFLAYAKLMETQTSGTNFATVQKVDFIIKVIECLIPPLL